MKTKILFSVILLIAMLCLCSCGDDDDSGDFNLSQLYGTWYGEKSSQSINVVFRENKTGQFTYESNVYYRIAEFTYSISGDKIICQGIIAGEDGVANNWNQTFEWRDSYLAPLNAYTGIYLYKGGVIPDNDDDDDFKPTFDVKIDFSSSSRTAAHYKNGVYEYIITVSLHYPPFLWDSHRINALGVAIDLKNGTIYYSSNCQYKYVSGYTYPCLYGTFTDDKIHDIQTELIVRSNESRLKINYIPFYEMNYNLFSLDRKTITLTPTKINEINYNI